jgi:CheY-like chemotaxis protein
MTASQPKTILIIEDEKEILYTLKEFLEFEDYQVIIAVNGLESMELLKTSVMPNLILLDMKMPIMNGWEFAAAFLAKYNQMSPIIAVTAAADAEQRAKSINAIDWIEKPFDLDLLVKKIKMHIR